MRHLVIVIPGMGGSVLAPMTPEEPVAWGGSVVGAARTLIHPSCLDLADHPELRPVDLVAGVTVFGRLTILPGYAELVRSLCNACRATSAVLTPESRPAPRAEVLRFPYDFRLGVAAAAKRLAQALHEVVGGADTRRSERPVLVVAHSMGGLVARYWLGPLEGWRVCSALVTLGTPHRGAPKALEWLVNGVRLGRTWQGSTNALRGWPGAWDLVPRYDAIWHDDQQRAVRPEDLPSECVATTGLLAKTASDVPAALAAGAQTHKDIDAGWERIPPGEEPALHAVFARDHATPSRAVLSTGRLQVTTEDPSWLPLRGWHGGDGTVPALSATPVELSETVGIRVPVWQRHGPMSGSPEVLRIIDAYEADSLAAVRGGIGCGVTLDLDDFALPGANVQATLRNANVTSQTSLSFQTRPAESPRALPRRWVDMPTVRTNEATWQASLPEAAGTYEVRVSATDVPGDSPAAAGDIVEVLAEADVEDSREEAP